MNPSTCFIDTSALFKRYIDETGTDKMDSLFESAALVIISILTVVEFVSNLKRLADIEKVIDMEAYGAIRNEFFRDIASGRIQVEAVSANHIVTSVRLIDRKYVTPIDSLQLAAVIGLKEICENISFVCSDKKLCALAENEHINVVHI
jgi:predicted nucleic acid-binding protein